MEYELKQYRISNNDLNSPPYFYLDSLEKVYNKVQQLKKENPDKHIHITEIIQKTTHKDIIESELEILVQDNSKFLEKAK